MYSSRDNWERLVAAVLKRQQIWQLCHENSRSPSSSSRESDSGEEILNVSSNNLEAISVSLPPQVPPTKTSLSPKGGKQKPRLERLNARKDIQYEYSPDMLSEAIEEIVEISGDGGVGDEVVDLPNREIEGNDEFVRYLDRRGEVISRNSDEIRDYGNVDRGRGSVFGCSLVDSLGVTDVVSSDHVNGKSSESHGGGIKGVRPPCLTPPPSMSLPVIDKNMSTWDMFRAFGPDSDMSNSRFQRKSSLDDDEEGIGNRDEDEDEEDGGRGVVREENCVLSGSYSFTTNSNDDSSPSTTTDTVSSISPNGRFGRFIIVWQKGDLLGRGSFGSVYEAIADDGFFFAVKEVPLLDQGDEGKQRILQLEQEIALLSQFQHENIVHYYGTATDESHLYIFLELVNRGSLLSLYQKYILKDSAVSGYTRQILHGLEYLHARNVVHRLLGARGMGFQQIYGALDAPYWKC